MNMQEGKMHCSLNNVRNSKIPIKRPRIASAAPENMKRKVNPFRKSTKSQKADFFDIGFEDSCYEDKSLSCTLSQNSDVTVRNIFNNCPKNENGIKNNNGIDVFNVDFEESKEESSQIVRNCMQSSSQIEKGTSKHDLSLNFKKPNLFRNTKVQSTNDFDLELRHEVLTEKQSQVSSILSEKSVAALSRGDTKVNQLFENQKKIINNAYDVDFEESREVSSPAVPSIPQNNSTLSCQNYNQDTSVNFNEPELFKNSKAHSNQPFDIDLEESGNLSQHSQNSQISSTSSQKSAEALSRGETKVNQLFENQKKIINNAFDVDFEESGEVSSPAVPSIPQNNSTVSCQNYNQDTSVNFNEPELFKNSKAHSNQPFDIDLEGSGNLSQHSQNSQISSTCSQKSAEALSRGETKVNQLFENQKKIINNAFDVDFEESGEVSSPAVPSIPQNSSTLSCQNYNQDTTVNFKKPELFKNSKAHSNQPFDIDLEESDILTQHNQNSQISSTCSQKSAEALSQGEAEKPPLFQSGKRTISNIVHVDFEESKDLSQVVLSAPESSPHPLSETCNQDTTTTIKKPELFKNLKMQPSEVFDIDLEESREKTQNTQYSQALSIPTQTSADGQSQSEHEKLLCIRDEKRNENKSFEVHFEESCDLEGGHSQNTKVSEFSNSNKEPDDGTSVKFAKPNPFRDGKQRSLNTPFDVEFEESRNVTDALNISRGTPNKSDILTFRKSRYIPKENDLEVNFNDLESNQEEAEKSSSSLTVNRDSLISLPVGTPRLNTTKASTYSNQSSFNQDNLDHWMSDHSEDEPEMHQEVELDTDSQRTRSLSDNPAPLHLEEEKNYVQQFQLKLKEIVENARAGKDNDTTSALPRQKGTQKPRKSECKRAIASKTRLRKPAPFATKRLYNHVIRKIKPKYGIDSVVQAEELIIQICDVVKMVVRRKGHQKKLINDLKIEMAKMGVIETTFQFYDFVREFLPYEFRLKVVPCIQPFTNIIYPPKEARNPFEKIL